MDDALDQGPQDGILVLGDGRRQQLVRQEHQHAGAGHRHAGHLRPRQPLVAGAAQQQQREHRSHREDQRT